MSRYSFSLFFFRVLELSHGCSSYQSLHSSGCVSPPEIKRVLSFPATEKRLCCLSGVGRCDLLWIAGRLEPCRAFHFCLWAKLHVVFGNRLVF